MLAIVPPQRQQRGVLHPNLLGEWNELAGRDHRCVADGGDEVALAASFDTQNTEAVLGVVDATRSTSPTPFEVLVFSAPGIKS
jgi:hypothetical protein